MKQNNRVYQKKAYVLLPQLIKEAQLNNLNQTDKQNISINSNHNHEKILLSKYIHINSMRNTCQLKFENEQNIYNNTQVSFRSEQIFNQDEFVKKQLKEVRKALEQKTRENNLIQKNKKSIREKTNQIQKNKSTMVNSVKQTHKKQSIKFKKNNPKERTDSIKHNTLKKGNDIKNYKSNQSYENDSKINSTVQVSSFHQKMEKNDSYFPIKSLNAESREQIQPVMNLVNKLITKDNMVLNTQKFEKFMKGLSKNKKFNNALRVFVYSYFLQNVCNQ